MYIIILVILIFISYFIFSIYEKFQAHIPNFKICYYDDIHNLHYKKYGDGEVILINDYLDHCNGIKNLTLDAEDLLTYIE